MEDKVILVISFIDSLGATITTPMLPLYAKHFKASNAEVGLVYSSFAFATLFALPIQGFLCKKIGARRTILISLVGTSVGCVWQGVASQFTSFLLARVFSGVWAAVSEACQIYMNQLNIEDYQLRRTSSSFMRGRLISLQTSRQLASIAGPAIGGVLSSWGLALPVLSQGFSSAVLFVISVFILKELELNLEQQKFKPLIDGSIKSKFEITRNPGIGMTAVRLVITVFGAVSLSGVIAWMSIQSMFPIFATHTYAFTPTSVGVVFFVCAIFQLLATSKVSKYLMTSQLRIEGTGILGSLLLMLGAAGIATEILLLSIASIFLATFGNALCNAAITSYYNTLTDDVNNVTVVTAISMTRKFGAIVGPIIAGRISELDLRYPFVLAAFAALTSAFLCVASLNSIRDVKVLKEHRRLIGQEGRNLKERGQPVVDEMGTREEVSELGEMLAGVLKKNHWRWITYKNVVPLIVNDVFVELDQVDAEENFQQMRWVQLHATNFRAKRPQTRPPVMVLESVAHPMIDTIPRTAAGNV